MKRVLVADDDRELVELLTRRCQGLGLAVDAAGSAKAALEALHDGRHDLVVLDVEMRPGNGLAVCEMMKTDAQLAAIPVIILTGRQDADTVRRCHQLCAYYVPKRPDIWSRVEPLVRELLQLEETAPAGSGVVGRAHAPRGQDLLDAVFGMLGGNLDFLADEGARPVGKTIDGPWVLCIDDDADLSLTLMLRLEQHGVQVLRAFAGMQGFRTACTCPAQAILLDYEMPDGRGDYVLRRLKECPLTRDIPVIVLTGRVDRALERQMYHLGAARFLNKPCDWEKLWAALSPYLRLPVAAG